MDNCLIASTKQYDSYINVKENQTGNQEWITIQTLTSSYCKNSFCPIFCIFVLYATLFCIAVNFASNSSEIWMIFPIILIISSRTGSLPCIICMRKQMTADAMTGNLFLYRLQFNHAQIFQL